MRLLRYISAAVGCAVLLAMCAPLVVRGQQAGQTSELSLGVTPAITELVLDAGMSKNAIITVSNLTLQPMPVKTMVTALYPAEDIAEKDQASFDASKWIHISEPDFILQSQQQKQITITVSPPPNAEPGGHYATILFHPLVPTTADGQNAAYIGSKVGVLAFMVVKGDIQEEVTIKNLASAIIYAEPDQLRLQLQNSGNVHVMPTGSISIYNIFGKHVETLPLPPTILLPKTTKEIIIPWDNKQRIGYYSAQAEITYGTDQKHIIGGRIHIWILPQVSLIGLLVVLGVMGFVAWRTRGRWQRALAALRGKGTSDKNDHRV